MFDDWPTSVVLYSADRVSSELIKVILVPC